MNSSKTYVGKWIAGTLYIIDLFVSF